MGQTLNHGVYLPAEGERNCYPGLASNWNLLDTAIGDIAGKASATHTHGNITNDGKVGTTANLPLITGTGGAVQAGSFGNSANTFCEGNDSRLSDARTPVAHTHTKSDVTDLLNSNFIPSANNSYDLGSSSYQWNNLYAKKVNTQSVNGINPGGLSLPNIRSGVQIDITNWNNRASPSGEIGNFTAPVDCIVSIQMTRAVDWGVWVINGNFRQSFRSADNNGNHFLFLTFPVAKGETIHIYCPVISSDETPITFVSNKQLYFPCLGNV